jgi:hypothetical protein
MPPSGRQDGLAVGDELPHSLRSRQHRCIDKYLIRQLGYSLRTWTPRIEIDQTIAGT